MRVFGSLQNRIMENTKPVTPTVGMGATELCYSDRHAFTIVEIVTPKKIVVQEDKAKRIDSNGFSENQEYSYSPDSTAPRRVITLRKDGRWKEAKSQTVFIIGERDEYHDYSF